MLIPVLEALRRRHPDAELDFLTLSGNVPLLERSGALTRVRALDVAGLRPFLRTFAAELGAIRRRGYDTVLDFEQFVKISTIIAFLSGARERIGFNTDGQRRGFLYTTRVVYTDSDHMTGIFARLTRPLGVTGDFPDVSLSLRAAERESARRILAEAGVAAEHFPLVAPHVRIRMSFYPGPPQRREPRHLAAPARGLGARHGPRGVASRARAPAP